MKNWRGMLAALAALALLAGGLTIGPIQRAISQGMVQITSLVGTEQVSLNYPCTVSCFVQTNVIRNSAGYLLVPTGTTVTTAPTNATEAVIATGAITTWGVTTPTAPYDGERFEIANATGSALTTNVSLTAASGSTLNTTYTSQTIAAGASAEWRYDLTTTIWYRIR